MGFNLSNLRENYGIRELNETNCPETPFPLFELWMAEAVEKIDVDANSMIISTTGKDMQPSSRAVLLKDFTDNQFIFYTHYTSKKGIQISENSKVSLLFWWKELERQIRIEGQAHKIPREISEAYFHSRPKGSQIGAMASTQSSDCTKELLQKNFDQIEAQFKEDKNIPLPKDWGGYAVTPVLIEFWQGRPNRMHDRIEYRLFNKNWQKRRLAP